MRPSGAQSHSLFTQVCGRNILRSSPGQKGEPGGYSACRMLVGTMSLRGLPMNLSEYKVVAGLAVSETNRAREFYEGKRSLSVSINSDDNVAYRWAEGTLMLAYLSPEHA